MNDIKWALEQIALGNAVQRVSIPGVYLQNYLPFPGAWMQHVGVYLTSDDPSSPLFGTTYSFTLDDAAAVDWDLYS